MDFWVLPLMYNLRQSIEDPCLFWELRLTDEAGDSPATGATSKINYSEQLL